MKRRILSIVLSAVLTTSSVVPVMADELIMEEMVGIESEIEADELSADEAVDIASDESDVNEGVLSEDEVIDELESPDIAEDISEYVVEEAAEGNTEELIDDSTENGTDECEEVIESENGTAASEDTIVTVGTKGTGAGQFDILVPKNLAEPSNVTEVKELKAGSSIDGGWYVATSNIVFRDMVNLNADVNIIISDYAINFKNIEAINYSDDYTLTIWATKDSKGYLNINGSKGEKSGFEGNLTINGGRVTIKGDDGCEGEGRLDNGGDGDNGGCGIKGVLEVRGGIVNVIGGNGGKGGYGYGSSGEGGVGGCGGAAVDVRFLVVWGGFLTLSSGNGGPGGDGEDGSGTEGQANDTVILWDNGHIGVSSGVLKVKGKSEYTSVDIAGSPMVSMGDKEDEVEFVTRAEGKTWSKFFQSLTEQPTYLNIYAYIEGEKLYSGTEIDFSSDYSVYLDSQKIERKTELLKDTTIVKHDDDNKILIFCTDHNTQTESGYCNTCGANSSGNLFHVHNSWQYSLKEGTTDTIEATCGSQVGICMLLNRKVSIGIDTSKDALEYTGSKLDAPDTLKGTAGWENAGHTKPSVSYEYKTTVAAEYSSVDEIKKAGYYKAIICAGEGENKVSAYKEFQVRYKISFDKNDSDATGTMDDAYSPEEVFNLPDCEYTPAESREFLGWSLSANGSLLSGTTVELDNNITLYAIWQTNRLVSYNLCGGAWVSGFTPTTVYVEGVGMPLPEMSRVIRTGYTFDGWYDNAYYEGSTIANILTTDKGNKTYYAKWTANKYTNILKYNANGGSGAPADKTVTVTYPDTQSKITVSTTKPKRTGYTFKGWYTAKSGGTKVGTTYTLGSNKKTANQSATIYAQWDINTYTITYKLNNGKNNSKNPASYKITTGDITLQSPVRTGYTFKGWYTDSKLTKKITVIKKGSTGNKTVYAKWEANKYTIKYNANGGSGSMKNQSMTYDKSAKLTKNGFTRKKYTFLGWNTDKKATKAKYKNQAEVKNLSSKSGGTVTLYAIWKKK